MDDIFGTRILNEEDFFECGHPEFSARREEYVRAKLRKVRLQIEQLIASRTLEQPTRARQWPLQSPIHELRLDEAALVEALERPSHQMQAEYVMQFIKSLDLEAQLDILEDLQIHLWGAASPDDYEGPKRISRRLQVRLTDTDFRVLESFACKARCTMSRLISDHLECLLDASSDTMTILPYTPRSAKLSRKVCFRARIELARRVRDLAVQCKVDRSTVIRLGLSNLIGEVEPHDSACRYELKRKIYPA